MWEAVIDFINNHGTEPPADNVDGTRKTSYMKPEYQPLGELGEIVNYYKDNFGAYDIQMFASLGDNGGLGKHTDLDDVLIIGLIGEVSYSLYRNNESKPFVTVDISPNESLLVPAHNMHEPICGSFPRATLSLATRKKVAQEDVTYYWKTLDENSNTRN